MESIYLMAKPWNDFSSSYESHGLSVTIDTGFFARGWEIVMTLSPSMLDAECVKG
jgi:hypothetical protein